MAYGGCDFIYDGVLSRKFGAKIMSFETKQTRYTGGSGVTITTDRSARSIKNKLIKAEYTPVLEFDMELFFERPPNDFVVSEMKTWLFSPDGSGFKKLYIVKEGMEHIYFNAILSCIEDIRITDGFNGMKLKVTCDSGGAWEDPRRYIWTYGGSSGSINFQNNSANAGYTYPKLEIVMAADAGSLIIRNNTDGGREFKMESITGAPLYAGERIIVDCEKETITSSRGLRRFSNCNKQFLRLKRGVNQLVFTGSVSELTAEYPNFRRIGA